MKRRYITIYLIFLVLAAVFGFLKMQQFSPVSHDVIEQNRIEKSVEKHWDDLNALEQTKYLYDYAVLNDQQEVLYYSRQQATCELSKAMSEGDTILPITRGKEFLGYVIIMTSEDVHKEQRTQFTAIYGVYVGILLLSGLILLGLNYWLNRNVVKPFNSIQTFAREIAQGNLEAKLPVKGNKVFLPFCQSLDLMRDEIKKAKAREYEANQSKKELVASLSHDIKTPVTSIKLAVEVLMVKVKEEDMKHRLEAINQKVEQIDHLVTDLFHTTMEDMEELKVEMTEVYSEQLIPLLEEADVDKKIKLHQLPNCMLRVDLMRIGQIFANIIFNSFKYAGTEITIEGKIAGNYLELTFQDYGKGVPSDELPLLFNRFYRGKNTGKASGSGLGLYICKCLIEKMNGEIYCDNNEQGFIVLLRILLAE